MALEITTSRNRSSLLDPPPAVAVHQGQWPKEVEGHNRGTIDECDNRLYQAPQHIMSHTSKVNPTLHLISTTTSRCSLASPC